MPRTINAEKGPITLYNPEERSSKYCRELKTKRHESGKKKDCSLSATEAAYRSGYLDARKESAKIFRKKNPNYKNKKGGIPYNDPSRKKGKKNPWGGAFMDIEYDD